MGDNISIEYLVDLLSSIKSALSNMDERDNDTHNILSEISENITLLAELNKKEIQDQKIMLFKFDSMVRELSNLSNEIKLNSGQILSSNEVLNNKVEFSSMFKKETIESLNKNIEELKFDLKYLKQKYQDDSLSKQLEISKSKKMVEELQQKENEYKKNDNIFYKIFNFIKNVTNSINNLYKIMILIFLIFLIIAFCFGLVTWADIGSILSGLKFFQ